MVIGSLGYVVNDALIRLATDRGLDVYQALCLRSAAMTVVFAAVTRSRRERITVDALRGPLALRVGAELIATALFFAAIVRLDFANAQTILLVVPFAVTLFAAILLGEQVTALRYAVVAAGFVGVLLVVQPTTDAFSPWSLAALGAAGCLTVREFATRRVDDSIPASTVALVTAASLSLFMGTFGLFTGWSPITGEILVILLAASACLVVGYVFTIQTVRVGDLSVSSPFRYTTLLGAVVLGIIVFDEIPDGLTIAGCLVILVAGLVSIRLEQTAPPRAETAAAAER